MAVPGNRLSLMRSREKAPRGSFLPEISAIRNGLQRRPRRPTAPGSDQMADELRALGVPVYDPSQGESELASLIHPRR